MTAFIILSIITLLIMKRWIVLPKANWTPLMKRVWWPWQNKWDDRKSE